MVSCTLLPQGDCDALIATTWMILAFLGFAFVFLVWVGFYIKDGFSAWFHILGGVCGIFFGLEVYNATASLPASAMVATAGVIIILIGLFRQQPPDGGR